MADQLLLTHGLLQIVRLAFAAYILWSLLILGRLAARMFHIAEADPTGRQLIEIGLGFALYSTGVRLAAVTGLATREVVLGLMLVPALVALRRRELAVVGEVELPGPRGGWLVVLALAIVAFPMALAPAVSYDALVYQLRVPEVTLWTGFWGVDPANSHTFFPAATQCLYLPAVALDPAGVVPQLVHFGFFALSLVALGAVAFRLGAGTGAWRAPVLFAAVPAAGIVAGWSWSDMTLLFALATAALALLDGDAPSALILLGLAASIKYSGLALVVPLAAVAAIETLRGRTPLARVAVGALGGLIVAAPWYVANAIATGNPVYPLLSSIFGGPAGSETSLLHWSTGGRREAPFAWWGYFASPGTLDGDLGGLGVLLVLAGGAVYAAGRRELRPSLLVLAGGAAMLGVFTPAPRVLLPLVAAGCVLTSVAASAWHRQVGIAWLATATTVLVLRGAMITAAHNELFFNPLPCATGIETESTYVARNFPPALLFERANTTLEKNAVVLSVAEPRLFGFPRRTIASAAADPPAIRSYLAGAGGTDEVVRRLRGRGVTHLLVASDQVGLTASPSESTSGLTPAEAAALRKLIGTLRLVDRQGALLLMALPLS